MTEAKDTGSTPMAWREVEGAAGPGSAAWLTLNRAEEALFDIGQITQCLLHLAVSPNEVKDDTWNFLAMQLHDRHQQVTVALKDGCDLISLVSRAEKGSNRRAEAAA